MKFKKSLFILSVIFSCFFIVTFAACSEDEPCEGEIIKKEFLEEYTEVRTITTMVYTGTVCVPIVRPYVYRYPDRWRLTVQWYEEESFHERQIYVTEECYEAVNLGDWFVYDKDFCTYSEPCERSKETH